MPNNWTRSVKPLVPYESRHAMKHLVKFEDDAFRVQLKKKGFIQSMSGTGNCYDNAVAESFFHTLKTEEVYFQWYATRAQARASIFEYIEVFYNRIR